MSRKDVSSGENPEARREICGHCVSYDMWCGICLHPESKLWEMDAEGIYDYPCCGLFTMEDSYKSESLTNRVKDGKN